MLAACRAKHCAFNSPQLAVPEGSSGMTLERVEGLLGADRAPTLATMMSIVQHSAVVCRSVASEGREARDDQPPAGPQPPAQERRPPARGRGELATRQAQLRCWTSCTPFSTAPS